MLMSFKIRTRLLLLSILALSGMAIIMAIGLYNQKQVTLDERKFAIKSQVETAVSIIKHYQDLNRSGVMSVEEAQKSAIAAMRHVRYGNGESFFITDTQQVYKLSPNKPEFEGQNKSTLQDKNGKFLLQDLTRAAQQGGGYVDYYFSKLGSAEALPKLSYAALVPEWNWVVGTGVYIDDIDAEMKNVLIWGLIELAILAILVSLLAWLITSSILRQLGGEPSEGIRLMQQLAQGDLQLKMQQAPVGSMFASLAEMAASLRKVMLDVKNDADVLSQQATQIAQSSQSIALAANQQTDATSAMAAAMEELTVSISHISDSSSLTEAASRQATALSRDGVEQVAMATTTMEHIAASVTQASGQIRALDTQAREISGIAAVIKDIAGQTNLLALNAAIEAARAGEQGRGFAVVADEVRKLAERTASATVNIETMLNAIQGETVNVVAVMDEAIPQVVRGVALAQQVKQSLSQIQGKRSAAPPP
ncbi:methyl-accepting chemotaxis protein [Deefgea piscis]|uniref:methyl-accepting chemotaxis protein n=1 Tax=Deefgea piscis TaxID=2739061 RepID=UPI001C7F26B2|nr:cache domain-containing protein [Deefgea piscis]QZA82146.1 cache domain-containing protein [Deefgea piscis]